jgi:wyosine [tRNA(Phe)-imidazoG37] synthetase (radical SAM superfamily)
VYCQLGRTVPLANERKEYFPTREILRETQEALDRHAGGIDWVTFVGSGEPTLHSRLGELIRGAKRMTSIPVAVITNGALLYQPDLRNELAAADAVLPTLDAGNSRLYRRLNRPHPAVTYERLLQGLCAFREDFHGRLWMEVMLVHGLNDGQEELEEIAAALQHIRPDEVHVNLPTRPPAEVWVQPADNEGLMRALAILGKVARVLHPVEGEFDLGGFDDLTDAIVAIITRHPVRQEELEHMLAHWAPREVQQTITDLRASGKAQVVERNSARFWTASPALFPNHEQSLRTRPRIETEASTPAERSLDRSVPARSPAKS